MTEYRVIVKQGEEIGYSREYKFYQEGKLIKQINGRFSQTPFLSQEHLFLIKAARTQEHILDDNETIKSIETIIIRA